MQKKSVLVFVVFVLSCTAGAFSPKVQSKVDHALKTSEKCAKYVRNEWKYEDWLKTDEGKNELDAEKKHILNTNARTSFERKKNLLLMTWSNDQDGFDIVESDKEAEELANKLSACWKEIGVRPR